MVNLVGDHAVAHKPLGAPLASDIESIARPASHWLRTTRDARSAATDTAVAVAARARRRRRDADPARRRGLGAEPRAGGRGSRVRAGFRFPTEAVEAAARALRSGALRRCCWAARRRASAGCALAARIAAATGARLFRDTFPVRLARGGGRPRPVGVPYLTEMAVDALAGLSQLVIAGLAAAGRLLRLSGAAEPARGSPSTDGDGAGVAGGGRARRARGAGRRRVGAARDRSVGRADLERVALPTGGSLDVDKLSAVVGALLPDGAIVVDEAVTASIVFVERTAGAGEHDYLFLTGGSIGWGLPAATGAAVGAPGRPVISLEADGSAMYTIQSLWTQAREGLDVTTIIIANRSYAILEFEFSRVGAEGDGKAAHELMDIGRPELDFAGLAQSMGVPGRRVDDVPGLVSALPRGARASPART